MSDVVRAVHTKDVVTKSKRGAVCLGYGCGGSLFLTVYDSWGDFANTALTEKQLRIVRDRINDILEENP